MCSVWFQFWGCVYLVYVCCVFVLAVAFVVVVVCACGLCCGLCCLMCGVCVVWVVFDLWSCVCVCVCC